MRAGEVWQPAALLQLSPPPPPTPTPATAVTLPTTTAACLLQRMPTGVIPQHRPTYHRPITTNPLANASQILSVSVRVPILVHSSLAHSFSFFLALSFSLPATTTTPPPLILSPRNNNNATSSEVARAMDQKPTKSRMMEMISMFMPRSGHGGDANALNIVIVVTTPPISATCPPTHPQVADR